MTCPDLTSLAGAVGGEADTALKAHVAECRTCREDLQILGAARRALHPPIEVPAYLDARVIQRIVASEVRSRSPGRPLDLAISALLVAMASFVAFDAAGQPGGLQQLPYTATFSILSGILAAFYHKRQVDRELVEVDAAARRIR